VGAKSPYFGGSSGEQASTEIQFRSCDLTRNLLTLWTQDDLIFIPEHYQIQFAFIIQVFYWTATRPGALFIISRRYQDINTILQQVPSSGWRLIIYNISQRWVKNNRDPENVVSNSAFKRHETFIYNDAAFLLTMAIADVALFGCERLDDLMQEVLEMSKPLYYCFYSIFRRKEMASF
jgi:hypothetical protein